MKRDLTGNERLSRETRTVVGTIKALFFYHRVAITIVFLSSTYTNIHHWKVPFPAEVEKHLVGPGMSASVGPKKEGIIGCLGVRLDENEALGPMDGSTVVDIQVKISGNVRRRNGIGIPPHTIRQQMRIWVSTSFLKYRRNLTWVDNLSEREKLNKLTEGLELGDVYGVTIEQIKAQDGG